MVLRADSTDLDHDDAGGGRSRFLELVGYAAFLVFLLYMANAAIRSALFLVPTYGFGIYALGALLFVSVWAISAMRWTPLGIALATFLAYVAWGLISGSQPFSDFLGFFKQANAFADDPSLRLLYEAKTPSTVVWFSAFSWMLGPTTVALRVGAAVAWALVAAMLSLLLRELGAQRRGAVFGALLFALSPGLIAYSSVVSSEAVLMAFLITALYFVHVGREGSDRSALVDYGISSFLFGMAYLAQPTALFFFAGYVALFFFFDLKNRHYRRVPLVGFAVFVVPFVIVVMFQVGLNFGYSGSLSPSPSPYMEMGLMQGTNQDTNGGWSYEDYELAGFYGPNKVSFEEASDRALRIGIERITSDPVGFARLATGAKITRLWGGEEQLVKWSLEKSGGFLDRAEASGFLMMTHRMVNGYFGLGMILFVPLAVVAWRRHLLGVVQLPILAALLGMILMFIFLVVQQRYHLVFMPFVYGLIGVSLADLYRTIRGRGGGESVDQPTQ